MGELSRAVASLRVSGEDLIPDEVTGVLGANPSMAYARGDQVASKHGAARVAKFGLWSCAGPETEPADIDAQVRQLLQRLTPDVSVWQQLAKRFDVDLFCGWFMEHLNEGVEISPATMSALAQRRIVLSLDIYCDKDGASDSRLGDSHAAERR